MTLSESVATLTTLIPALKANDAKFASDLIASFKKYGGLTPKQEPWIGKLILRATAPSFVPLAPAAINVGGFAGVIALFTTAKAHLKFPKIRLVLNGTKIIVSLNGPKSKRPGHVSISGEGVYPNRAFYGSVSPEGVFTPFKSELAGLTGLLSELASNPARVAKDHGKLTGNCCFCNKVLGLGKEQRSVLVGFGPDCAEHYGLKAEWLSGVAKAEAKASVVEAKAHETLISIIAPEYLGEAKAAVVESEAKEATLYGDAPEPTLSASDWVEDGSTFTFAESLSKATGAVSVTVTDGPVTTTFPNEVEVNAALAEIAAEAADQAKNDDDKAQDAANHEALQAELGPAYGQPDYLTECFFCETPSTHTKTLHGFAVCPSCVAQLK